MKKINFFIVLFMLFSVVAKSQVTNGNFESGNSGFSVEGGVLTTLMFNVVTLSQVIQ